MQPMPKRRPMLWIHYALGILLVLLSVAYWSGHRMSPEYGGRAELLMNAPPERVWAALQDVETTPHGGSMCRSVALEGEGDLLRWVHVCQERWQVHGGRPRELPMRNLRL